LIGNAGELIVKAGKAAEKEEWDTAIQCLREVIRLCGTRTPEIIRKNLAVCLNSRAVEKANRAGKLLEESQKSVFNKIIKGYWF